MKLWKLSLSILLITSTAWGVAGPAYLYDYLGNGIGSTAGALNVSATVTTAGTGNTGAAVPTAAMYAGFNKGGLLTGGLIGQQTMANSLACVLPSDQSAIPVTESGVWNITNVSGTVSLPTGASTSALQSTGNTSLASILAALPATLGQKAMAASLACTLASDQSAIPVTGTFWQATQPVTGTFWQATQPVSGTVTANQGTANATPWNANISQINGVTTLMGNGVTGTGSQRVTIASDNTAFSVNAVESGTWSVRLQDGAGSAVNKGQTTMAGSLPVTIASDQVAPKTYANTAGSFVLNTTLTTVITETAPATAVGFILEASSSNAANIRWAVGATATTTSGMRLEPGRDTGFVPVAASVTVVAESGTLEYELTWIKQ